MKILSVLIIVGGFISVLFLPSSVSASHALISISKQIVIGPDFSIDIFGTGFDNTVKVSFTYMGNPTDIEVRDLNIQSNVLELEVNVPSNTPSTVYTIEVLQHDKILYAFLNITANVAQVTEFTVTGISPSFSSSGRTLNIVIQGSNFSPARGITEVEFIRVTPGSGNISTSNIKVENIGRITLSIVIPAGTTSGTFQVRVTQSGVTKSRNFTVTGTSGTTQPPSTPTDTVPTSGEAPPPGFRLPTGPTSGKEIIGFIQTAGNWVFAIFLSLSLIYILLAAFQFITNGGDIEKISQARQKLIYAIIGIALALVAAGFDNVLRNILGLQ